VFDRFALRAIGNFVTARFCPAVQPPKDGWDAWTCVPAHNNIGRVNGCVPGCSAIDSGVNAVITVCDKKKDALLGPKF
jgi:hypothetical protein